VIVSIDFDDTFTADPVAWTAIIKLLQDASHTVVCVTGRDNTPISVNQITHALPEGIPIVFAGSDPKNDAAIREGFNVDVWIDDRPLRVMGKAKSNFLWRASSRDRYLQSRRTR
jgi:hypothetical protein